MKRLFNFVILFPLGVLLILISVANRQPVRFSLDPLSSQSPALSVELPLFVLLFAILIVGLLLGGIIVWFTQGKHRKALREKSLESEKLKKDSGATAHSNVETEVQKEIAPGLPMISRIN